MKGAVMLSDPRRLLRVRTGDYRILYMLDDERLVLLAADADITATSTSGETSRRPRGLQSQM